VLRRSALSGLLIAALAVACSWATDWSRYKVRTLKEIVHLAGVLHADHEEDGVMTGFEDELPSRARVNYMGKSRPVSASRRRAFSLVQESLAMRVDLPDLFQNELLFREVDREYWVAVQEPTRQHYAIELRQGDPVEIFVILLAAERDEKGEIDPILVANNFEPVPKMQQKKSERR
jgi:hypothetical protein